MPDIDYTQPAVPDAATRLRDAFALLLMRGTDQAAPMDDLWKAQGQTQLPAPQGPPATEAKGQGPDWITRMPEAQGNPQMNLPVLPEPPGLNLSDQPKPPPPKMPIDPNMFPDAKSLTVRPSPFTLPKKAKR